MTQIASEDYVNKLIYLHVDTVTSGWDPAVMQQEHRTRRRLNANGERNFYPMVSFSGYVEKGAGKYTPKLTLLAQGVRVVPYDTGSSNDYNLDILNEVLDPHDVVSDRDVIDRQGITAHVNVDSVYNPVEIVVVDGGGGTGGTDPTEVWNHLLDSGNRAQDELTDALSEANLAKLAAQAADTTAEGAETAAQAAETAAINADAAADAANISAGQAAANASDAKLAADNAFTEAEAAKLQSIINAGLITDNADLINGITFPTQKITEIWQAHFHRRYWNQVADTITIYDSDNTTPLFVFDANSDLSDIVPQ